MKRSSIHHAGVAGVLCTCLLLLSGCGGSSSSDAPLPSSTTSDNSTDAEWNASNWNEGEWQ